MPRPEELSTQLKTPLNLISQLSDLHNQMRAADCRLGVLIDMSTQEAFSLMDAWLGSQSIASDKAIWLGGATPLTKSFKHLTVKQGSQLLGQEIEALVVDASAGFDANSFNSACGALKAGGFLFFLNLDHLSESHTKQWLKQSMKKWLTIRSNGLLSKELRSIIQEDLGENTAQWKEGATLDQHLAIRAIEKVVSGHRKRPLLMTAHRGRGKSAALGMAVARLVDSSDQPKKILMTAPNKQAVQSVFKYAQLDLSKALSQKTDSRLLFANGSTLEFIAPDVLVSEQPEADLLLIDEAAALPLPILIALLEKYHRLVMSSTVHGYEGSGMSMTHKLKIWLEVNRPGWQEAKLTQPIRWCEHDPLEQWQFDTFLLSPKPLPNIKAIPALDTLTLEILDKSQFPNASHQWIELIELLTHAHYQTTPNDVWQWIDDPNVFVYRLMSGSQLCGCVIINKEGGLDSQLVEQIMLGQRRPKGHLVPVQLAQHVSCHQAAIQTCARIMRIAIHPDMQQNGLGQHALSLVKTQWQDKVDYLASSFGATPQLVRFWAKNYQCVRLGNHKDTVSGCFSAVMIEPLNTAAEDWVKNCQVQFLDNFYLSLTTTHNRLSSNLVIELLKSTALLKTKDRVLRNSPLPIDNRLYYYAQGGGQFESVHNALKQFVWYYLQTHSDEQLNKELAFDALIALVLQHRKWTEISTQGKKALESIVRCWLKHHLAEFTV